MVFGYNNQQTNKTIRLRRIFFIVRAVYKILSVRKFCRIESINFKNHQYFVTFFYPGEAIIFIKSADQILKSTELISKFSPFDAAILGFCISDPSKNNIDQLKKYFCNELAYL